MSTFAQPPHELPASSLTCLSAPRPWKSPTTRQHAAQLSSSETFALFWPFSHASRCWQLSRKCVRLRGEPFQSGGSIRRTTKVEAGTGVPRGRLAPKNHSAQRSSNHRRMADTAGVNHIFRRWSGGQLRLGSLRVNATDARSCSLSGSTTSIDISPFISLPYN